MDIIDQLAGTLALVGMMLFAHAGDRQPLFPWDRVGSNAYILVVNERR
jgi:hypothetical protein